MRSKCFIQRCKTVILCNGSAFKFPTQFIRRNSSDNLSAFELLHQLVIMLCDKQILLERGFLYREYKKKRNRGISQEIDIVLDKRS